jgi:phage terminase large subunit
VTRNSANLLKEYRNYLWKCDKEGKVIAGVPEDGNDHCLDAVRYAVDSLIPVMRKREYALNLPSFITQQKSKNRAR